MTAVYIVIGILILFLAAYIATGLHFFRFVFIRKEATALDALPACFELYAQFVRESFDELTGRGMKRAEVTTPAGLRLSGLFFDAHSDKCALIVPGYTSSAYERCVDAQVYIEAGFSVLIIDNRAHGQSEGRYIGFGAYEREDIPLWIDYIEKTCGPEVRIVLDGISMGAASVMMCCGDTISKAVRACVADCGYSSLKRELMHQLRLMKLPRPFDGIAYSATRLFVRAVAKYDPNDVEPVAAVSRTSVPIFFLHGKQDDFVPYAMMDELYNACASDKESFTVPAAGHGACRMIGRKRCEKAMMEFIEIYI